MTYGPNGFGNVKNTASVGNMNYNALQAVLQKRFSHGLEAQVSYSFEKCMTNDDGYYGTWGATTQAGPSGNYWQNLYNPNGDYARCYWDSTNVLSAYAVYELPFRPWQTIWAGHADGGECRGRQLVDQPDYFLAQRVPAFALWSRQLRNRAARKIVPTALARSPIRRQLCPGMQWFGQGSFANAATGTFGNCPAQGPVIGPGYVDADISLQKNFPDFGKR